MMTETEDRIIPVEEVVPWCDYLLVRPIDEEETSPAGLYVPSGARGKASSCARGQVIATSPFLSSDDPTDPAPSIQVGERVYYETDDAREIQVDGVTHFVVAESSIRAVIRIKPARS